MHFGGLWLVICYLIIPMTNFRLAALPATEIYSLNGHVACAVSKNCVKGGSKWHPFVPETSIVLESLLVRCRFGVGAPRRHQSSTAPRCSASLPLPLSTVALP